MLGKSLSGVNGGNVLYDPKHREEWLNNANASECATNIDKLFKDQPEVAKTIKAEMLDKVYEALGGEIEGGDLVRALVVRNEKAGFKTNVVLMILTLGLWYCFRPRDDDTVLVLTNTGRVVQLRVERPACCPNSPTARFFVVAKCGGILFSVFVLPILVQSVITGRSIVQELHMLHLDRKGLKTFPAFLKEHRIAFVGMVALMLFWICTLIPHDYRDRYRRRHMTREVAAAQFTLTGWTCRRRSSMKLFFGKYPPQAVLNVVGNLGNMPICGPVPPASLLETGRPSAPMLIVMLTVFISVVNGLDTAFTWHERSVIIEHITREQAFCRNARDKDACSQKECQLYGAKHNLDFGSDFCPAINWNDHDKLICLRYGREAPCCSGCEKGAYQTYTSEGTLATFKSMLSLVADVGTMLFALLAAQYAIGLIFATDHIDVLIKRRSVSGRQLEIAKFDNTLPISSDFMQHVFYLSKNQVKDVSQATPQAPVRGASLAVEDAGKWCGVMNFEIDENTQGWEDYFEAELKVPPDCRWTAKVHIPRKCLGIAEDETVIAAWAEMPLHPLNMTMTDLLTGGLLYTLLPFGKTRHSVIVTNRRLFYVRYRRPTIPIQALGVSLRIDCFRHDHDVFYGQMLRTKVAFPHKMIHQKFLREDWLPGVVAFQNKFGALSITRKHGDVQDVYQLICSLSRNVSTFLTKEMLEAEGFKWDSNKRDLGEALKKESPTRWSIQPQLDDMVEPRPDIQLGTQDEQLIFHMCFKDLCKLSSGTYTNTDVVVTTGRLFFWNRQVYKRFDCQACLYWCLCWTGFMNPILSAKNLHNMCSFFTLPALLSFSTDLSVDPPSWLAPHHQPLKVPLWERLCQCMTHCIARDGRTFEGRKLSAMACCPKRTSPSAQVLCMWRLKQSAHADEDFVITFRMKPYTVSEAPESDAEDIYLGLGFSPEQIEDERRHILTNEHDDKLDVLRIIMSVVQDQCHKILDKVDVLY